MKKKTTTLILLLLLPLAIIYWFDQFTEYKERIDLIFSDEAIQKNNLSYCEAIKQNEYTGIFDKFDNGPDGKPALLFMDGKYHKPYGLWQSIKELERGDSIIKRAGAFDLEVYRIRDSTRFFRIEPHNHLPC